MTKETRQLSRATVRFAGDSGDGMQLTGTQFTNESAVLGNDISTLPDFPAEIRAPAGTIPGVSGFQVQFASVDIMTPGDAPDCLVAMNPAALRANLGDLKKGGIIIANGDAFTPQNLKKAGYDSNPLEDGSLRGYRLHVVPMTSLTEKALEGLGLGKKETDRSKNFFALGLAAWLYDRPIEPTLEWIEKKFAKAEKVAEANRKALKAGYHFGETAEVFQHRYQVPKARLAPGRYRKVTGNEALAMGLITASKKSGLPLFYGSYPITPASDILHELSRRKQFGVITFQAEDEIAAVCAAIGASYAGALGVTASSGPGIALKGEAVGLAVMTELPLVVVNIQRGGPSTGLPTKTEQADLLQALFGRNGECPVGVVAASMPSDCFTMALEAARMAIRHRVPVFLLSDGYLGNGSEPWRIPDPDEIEPIDPGFATRESAEKLGAIDEEGRFLPYVRDEETLARPWAIPGTPGLVHRIGGLEKADRTGNVSYDPDNHFRMVRLRQEKVERMAKFIPPQEVFPEEPGEGEVLCVSWGSTFGAVREAVGRLREKGFDVSHAHLRYLNPMPPNLGDVLGRFEKILVPEMNLGQLQMILRAKFLVDAVGIHKVAGRPFTVEELEEAILQKANPKQTKKKGAAA